MIRFSLIALILLLIASCSESPPTNVQGYIEGRYTYIATSVSGVLKELLVERGAEVKNGQQLLILEEQPESDVYRAAQENLKEAIASRDATTANLSYAKITYERYKILVIKNAIEKSQLDLAKSNYDALLAQLERAHATIAAAEATLAQAKWALTQKFLYAPIDGIVFDTYYRLGEYVAANQSILSLLAPANIKAVFFISEKYLGNLRLNDKVTVDCDNCKRSYRGKISFISPSAEYTPPVIYSNETNVKLIYRIEASFAPQDAINLHPGQPVRVTFYPHD